MTVILRQEKCLKYVGTERVNTCCFSFDLELTLIFIDGDLLMRPNKHKDCVIVMKFRALDINWKRHCLKGSEWFGVDQSRFQVVRSGLEWFRVV